jgi:hypothetical protein
LRKIIRGISPNSQATLAELRRNDYSPSCDSFPGETEPPITTSLYLSIGAPYGYWYHYLLQWTNGNWNNNGKKHVTLQQLIALSFGVEVDGVGNAVDSTAMEKMAEAFGRKGWEEGMYRFIGGRQSVQSLVNLGLYGDSKGGVYDINNQTKFITSINSALADYKISEGSDFYKKASMILSNVEWRGGVLGNASYEWANVVSSNPDWFKD